jgi:hypothetical protein
MRTQCLLVSSLAVLVTFAAGAAAADPVLEPVVIDDFAAGPFQQVMPALPADWGTYYQALPSEVLGGVRQINLIADDTLGASSSIDIGEDRLRVSTGIGSYFGAFLGYGYDADGGDGGMDADFSGHDHFQIDFERSDLGLVYIVEIVDAQGTLGMLAGTLTTEAQSLPHTAEFARDDFQGTDTQGNPQAIDWAHIHYLIVLFQSGNASGGNDFSVTEIRAVDKPDDPVP